MSDNIDFPSRSTENENIPNNMENKSNEPRNESPVCLNGPIPIDPIDQKTPTALTNQLKELQDRCAQYESVLQHRDNCLAIQKRELDLLEMEKSVMKRDLDTAVHDKESTVVRYAMAEKNILKLRTENDQLTKKLKDSIRETEALQLRVNHVINDKDRVQKDLRKSINECDGFKNDLLSLETKSKWTQVKLKQEMAVKQDLERRVIELTGKLAEQVNRQQLTDSTVKREERELEAQLIMYKHANETKDREIAGRQDELKILKQNQMELEGKLNELRNENERLKIDLKTKDEQVQTYEFDLERKKQSIKELEENSIHLTNQLDQLSNVKKSNENINVELNNLKTSYEEQSHEMDSIRIREENLMLFTKELTEQSVELEREHILATNKITGLSLENERIKSNIDFYWKKTTDLEEMLVNVKRQRTDEMTLMGQLIAEKTNKTNQLKIQFDTVTGDFEAYKRKHLKHVQELQRELSMVKDNYQKMSQSQATQTDPSDEIVVPNCSEQFVEPKAPTAAMLIERIIRLQRALARQTEKNEFLENHCATLVKELKFKP